MPLVRALAVVLVAVLGAGSTLLDSCVLGCQRHVHAHEATPPDSHSAHCHQDMAPGDQPQWQPTSTCNHDHSERPADVGQPRPDGLKMGSLAIALRPAAPTHDQLLVSRTISGADFSLPFQSRTSLSPLRL